MNIIEVSHLVKEYKKVKKESGDRKSTRLNSSHSVCGEP